MTQDQPIRIGLVGAGRIGRLHARLVAHEVAGLTLAAVYDVNRDAADEAAQGLGASIASSAQELLESPETDAVAICTSVDTHVELVLAAARSGKPIFLEKPVSYDLGEVDRAIAAIDESGVYLQVGFNRRFDPAHASVHASVARGDVGDLHLVRISSRDPEPPPPDYPKVRGGLFLDTTVHDFDMARFVTGSEVDELYAVGEARVDPGLADVGDYDTAVTTLRHTNRAVTVIDNSRHAAYGYDQRVEAFGSAGMATSHNPPLHTGTLSTASGTTSQPLPHFFLDRYVSSYRAQWVAFEHAVRTGLPPPVTIQDGRAALVLALAALRSAEERTPVAVAGVA